MKSYRLSGKAASCLLMLAALHGHASAADCKPRHTFPTLESGVLTVAAYTNPPYIVPKEDGTLSGIDGEILNKIAAMECLKMKVLASDGAAAIQNVAANRADMTLGDWFRTTKRAKVMGLSAPLYVDAMGIYSKDKITKVDQLVGRQVGVTVGSLWNEDLKKIIGADLHIYPNYLQMNQDLQAGRITAAVDGYGTGIALLKAGELPGFSMMIIEPDERVKGSVEAGQSTFPYNKSNTELGAALDADIAELHTSGDIAGIVEKYGLSRSVAETGPARLMKVD